MEDMFYMKRALELAEFAIGDTSPNPVVGCVLTDKNGNIVGEGYHQKAGSPHAEVMAIKDAEKNHRLQDIYTAYVTLEPCSHFGRTGPCCDALITVGVKRVVCTMADPNPKVSGEGFMRLKKAGIKVEVGLCAKEAKQLNEKFLFWITHKKPFVSLKYAMTLDGKIATKTGDSKWITGEKARKYAHYLRKTHDAILVGIKTILEDDAELTNRSAGGRSPCRIVLDTKLRIPLTARVLQGEAPTIIVTGEKSDREKIALLEQMPVVSVWQIKEENGHISLEDLMERLAENTICSLLVEGGSEIHGAFLKKRFVNRVYAFIAPIVLGGKESLTAIGGASPSFIKDSLKLEDLEVKNFGEDILLTGKVKEELACLQD